MRLESLNESSRVLEIRTLIQSKKALHHFYSLSYEKYRQCLQLCPQEGSILEIGSGAGFAKEFIPELCASDIIPYPNIDKVIDATRLSFEDNSLRAIFLLNTFHHIPDVDKFLTEACRCLKPGGRILIIDQHVGFISRIVLEYLHHEPFNPNTETWSFQSSGPLTGANGALAWIVFERDKERFEKKFSLLKLVSYSPHTPLLYWVSGGLKKWSMAPKILIPFWQFIDRLFLKISRDFGSFTDIEIYKRLEA